MGVVVRMRLAELVQVSPRHCLAVPQSVAERREAAVEDLARY